MIEGIDRTWQTEARSEETNKFIKDIKRLTRRKFNAKEKVRIVLEGFCRNTPIRDLCHQVGIQPTPEKEGRKSRTLEARKDHNKTTRENQHVPIL